MRGLAHKLVNRTGWLLIALVFGAVQFAPLFYFAGNAEAATTGTLYPQAQGTYDAWTYGKSKVDETDTPNCDSNDSISENVTGDRESVNIDLASIADGDTVSSVTVHVWDSGDLATGGTYKTFVRLGTTNTDASTDLVTTSISGCTERTQTIDIVDFVKSSTTNLQIGVLKTGGNTNMVRVGALSAVATYDVTPRPDLTATKTNNVSNNATVNVPFNWNIRVSNAGAATATFDNAEEILRDDRPSDTLYGAPSISYNGTTGTVVCSESDSSNSINRRLTCSASGTVSIPVGAYIDIAFSATSDSTTTLTNPRSTNGDNGCRVDRNANIVESNDNNNACSNTVTVSAAPPVAPITNPPLGESCGIDVALVIDTSGSIDDGELATMKTALNGFVDEFIGTSTRMAVVSFDDSAVVQSNFTSDLDAVKTVINSTNGDGLTNWDDALYDTRNLFPDRADKPDLIVFTSDGNPTTSDGPLSHLEDAIVEANAAKTADIRIITLGIGNDVNASNLQQISSADAYYGAADFGQLADTLHGLVTDLCGGTITMQKLIDADGNIATTDDQSPASGWEFDVNGTASDPVPGSTDSYGYTQSFNVNDGTYSVTETMQSGYSLLSAVCSGATDNGSLSGSTISGIVVDDTDIINCVFVNTLSPASLTITKSVINDDGGDLSASSFPLFVNGNSVNSGQSYNYSAGTYTITETPQSGYAQTTVSGNCTKDAQGVISVILAAGQNATCTITNDDQPATLIIRKIVINDNGGTWTADDFEFIYDGSGFLPFTQDPSDELKGENTLTVPAGNYNISEKTTSGYMTTPNGCGLVMVTVGETHICTFTNDDIAPTLTLIKKLGDNMYGSPILASAWTLTATDPFAKNILKGTTGVNGNVEAGLEYTLGEQDGPSGFTVSSWECVLSGTLTGGLLNLGLGQNETCTITNTAVQPKLTVIKHVVGDGNASDFEMLVNGTNVSDSAFPGNESPGTTVTLNVGAYSVSEKYDSSKYSQSLSEYCSGTINLSESKTCTITNTRNEGKLKIVKDAIPNDNLDFSFTGNNGIGSFTLDDDSNNTYKNYKEFTLKTGVYQVTENSVSGWSLSNLSCTGDAQWGANGSVLTVDVIKDKTMVCTFTNTRDTGTVTIVKDAKPNSDTNFSFEADFIDQSGADFYLDDDANATLPNARTFTVQTGKYDVEEINIPSSWKLTDLVCTGDDHSLVSLSHRKVTLDVDKGENITCTFTNTKLGKITIAKDTNPEQNSDLRFGYSGTLGSYDLYDDDTDEFEVLPGSYTFTEHEKNGWYLSDIICTGDGSISKDIGTRTVTITLKPGELETCKFVNNKKGKIEGEKFNDKNANRHEDWNEEDLPGWTIFIDKNGNEALDNGERSTVTDHHGDYSFNNLMPGTYSICEVQQHGWYSTLPNQATCQTTTIHSDGGDVDEINFSNAELSDVHGYKWEDINGNGIRDCADENDGEEDFNTLFSTRCKEWAEPLLAGWTIELYKSNGNGGFESEPFKTVVTSDDSEHYGSYWFEDLMPGQYKICEVNQFGWAQTYPSSIVPHRKFTRFKSFLLPNQSKCGLCSRI